MPNEKTRISKNADEFDKHVERCLSMVLHYEEVQQIAEIAKKVFRIRENEKESTVKGKEHDRL